MAHVASLTIYPLKSFDGLSVAQAAVLPSGSLEGDRRFAVLDSHGGFVNAKRIPAVQRLRPHFDLGVPSIQLQAAAAGSRPGERSPVFPLAPRQPALEQWLSDYFGFACQVVRDELYGFPDVAQAAGPTVVGTGTLQEVASWFPPLTLDEVRRRFRANIEIGSVEPFWEDRLYGEPGQGVRFRIGPVEFLGTNPCQRCAVPTRHPDTAEVWPDFARQFSQRRRDSLPAWAAASQFDHFYRLAVNTRLAASGATPTIRLGDAVSLVS